MQYFAFNEKEELISASLAEKGKTYLCPECGNLLRKRVSEKKRPHFYHLKTKKTCPHKKRSYTHLTLQKHLFDLFPEGEIFLEHRFPSISRIADLYFKSQGIVFEVQCSKITPEEMDARERDYKSLGLEVVWLLYEELFYKKCPSRIRDRLSYYINLKGVYDQIEIFEGKKRIYRSLPYPVDLRKSLTSSFAKASLPLPLQKRPFLYFLGDAVDLTLRYPKFREWVETLPQKKKVKPFSFQFYERFLSALYRCTHPSSLDSSLKSGNRRKPQRQGSAGRVL